MGALIRFAFLRQAFLRQEAERTSCVAARSGVLLLGSPAALLGVDDALARLVAEDALFRLETACDGVPACVSGRAGKEAADLAEAIQFLIDRVEDVFAFHDVDVKAKVP
jgi:hypothetical protein